MAQLILAKCDDRIKTIGEIFDTCIQVLGQSNDENQKITDQETQTIHKRITNQIVTSTPLTSSPTEKEGMEIIATLLCSSVRSSHSASARVNGLMLMQRLADHGTNYTRLQRLIPYTCALLSDSNGLVKASAIRTLTYVLTKVTSFPASEANLFNDYILPALRSLYIDSSDMVRVTFSEHLPLLSYQAKRFLEMGQLIKQNTLRKDTSNMIKGTYDSDLAFLQEEISSIVYTLSMDECALVKRALLLNIVQLCMFYGRRKTNDFVLPIVITFLNCRDWRLRHAFFEQIVGISMFVGPSSLKEFILPCIMNTLYDTEEFVIEQALTGLVALAELGMFTKPTLLQIAPKVAPLLHHPNTWIRTDAVACFSAMAKRLGPADAMCFLINNVLRGHLEYNTWIVTESSLLESIKGPVSRFVYDRALTTPLDSLLSDIKVSPEDVEKLTLMRPYLEQTTRVMQSKSWDGASAEGNQASSTEAGSGEVITLAQAPLHTHYIPVDSPFTITTTNQQSSSSSRVQISPPQKQFSNEWNTIFNKPTPRRLIKTRSTIMGGTNGVSGGTHVVSGNTSINSDSDGTSNAPSSPSLPSTTTINSNAIDMHPCHLHGQSHEHRGSINELAVHDSGAWFISGGNDGSVRVWDIRQADRDFSMTSKSSYTTPGRILSVAIPSDSVYVTCSNDRGWVHFFHAELGATVFVVSVGDQGAKFVSDVDPQQATPSVNVIRPFAIHSTPLLVCGTQSGLVVGLDPRMAREAFAWRSKDSMQQGPITSICGDETWMATGTRRGFMTLWDLRFQINVCTSRVTHNSINRMAVCTSVPGETLQHQQHLDITSPSIYVATGSRDIKLFNLETQSTIAMFRCHDNKSSSSTSTRKRRSTAMSQRRPSLSDPYAIKELEQITWDQYNNNADVLTPNSFEVKALHVAQDGNFYTGSTDRKIRYWNMHKIENSYVVSGLENNEKSIYTTQMDQQHAQQVVSETIRLETSPLSQTSRRGGVFSSPVVTHHLDTITDIKSVSTNLLVSCSRDGILKVWK
jgi:phosphoinositide-3-kinase regulatory subunit 4